MPLHAEPCQSVSTTLSFGQFAVCLFSTGTVSSSTLLGPILLPCSFYQRLSIHYVTALFFFTTRRQPARHNTDLCFHHEYSDLINTAYRGFDNKTRSSEYPLLKAHLDAWREMKMGLTCTPILRNNSLFSSQRCENQLNRRRVYVSVLNCRILCGGQRAGPVLDSLQHPQDDLYPQQRTRHSRRR
jgi:hypothetical protein